MTYKLREPLRTTGSEMYKGLYYVTCDIICVMWIWYVNNYVICTLTEEHTTEKYVCIYSELTIYYPVYLKSLKLRP